MEIERKGPRVKDLRERDLERDEMVLPHKFSFLSLNEMQM